MYPTSYPQPFPRFTQLTHSVDISVGLPLKRRRSAGSTDLQRYWSKFDQFKIILTIHWVTFVKTIALKIFRLYTDSYERSLTNVEKDDGNKPAQVAGDAFLIRDIGRYRRASCSGAAQASSIQPQPRSWLANRKLT